MWETIVDFFIKSEAASTILEIYLVFILFYFIIKFILKSKLAISITIPVVLFYLCYFLAKEFEFTIALMIFRSISYVVPIIVVVVLAPEIRSKIEKLWIHQSKSHSVMSTSDDSKQAIAQAVMYLSSRKIGALITIEKHRMLDQYSEKAILMNADISKELLINIFSPLTPLHDGAVIIKSNKIRCAGAYYVLSQRDNLDKTVGSRHRAALGIAEVTDSVTIVVSEETGNISIAYSGICLRMYDESQLLEYIDLAMEKDGAIIK